MTHDHTLEWFATSPPFHHSFERQPRIRSERPTWDIRHPEAPAIADHGRRAP